MWMVTPRYRWCWTQLYSKMSPVAKEVPRLGDHAMRHNCRVRFLTSDAQQLPSEVREAVAELEE